MGSPSSGSITTTPPSTINNEKLQQFIKKYYLILEEQYKTMANFGKPITSQELANLTAISKRYIREWLANQTAGGYLTYDPATQRYTLPIEHDQALVNENNLHTSC
jgi:hypothetical protein